MEQVTLNRRQFLHSTAQAGLSLTLAAALASPAAPVLADNRLFISMPASISIPGGLDIWKRHDTQAYLAGGTGALWVAGRFLNHFAYNRDFNNLPYTLKRKYQFAGGEYKGLPAAEAIWKTIPASVRAGGPEALRKFHQGKDWSHFIPRSAGGPTTAGNGTWWSSEKNKSLRANPMSAADIADAHRLLRTDALKAVIRGTLSGMVKGAMVGVVGGATLAVLTHGLDYAEGKISWNHMVSRTVTSIITAGAGATLVAGLVLGMSLTFPFLIPILLPALFAIQTASIVFLGPKIVSLAKGWWNVLDGQRLLAATDAVLRDVRTQVRGTIGRVNDSKEESLNDAMRAWVNWIARVSWTPVDWVWKTANSIVRELGADRALVWFSEQLGWALGPPAYLVDVGADAVNHIAGWGYTSIAYSADAIANTYNSVVATQFRPAVSTTNALLGSIAAYR